MAGSTFERIKKAGDDFVQNVNLVSARVEDVIYDGTATAAVTLSYQISDTNALLASGVEKPFNGVSAINVWVVNEDTASQTDTSTLTFKFFKEGVQVDTATVSLTSVPENSAAIFPLVTTVELESIDDYQVTGTLDAAEGNTATKIIIERVGGGTGGSGGTPIGSEVTEGTVIFGTDPDGNAKDIQVDADGHVMNAGYDDISDLNRIAETNPADLKFEYAKLELSATTGSLTLDMDGYGELYIHADVDSVGFTILGSLDYTATATAANFLPITSDFTGSTANITTDQIIFDDSGVAGGCKYIKIYAAAATTCTIWTKRKQQV